VSERYHFCEKVREGVQLSDTSSDVILREVESTVSMTAEWHVTKHQCNWTCTFRLLLHTADEENSL